MVSQGSTVHLWPNGTSFTPVNSSTDFRCIVLQD